MSARDLDGRVAIVTGASRGLGRAMAEHFAAAGARVAVVDLKRDWAGATAAAIAAEGGEAIAIGADVSDRDTMAAACAEVADRWDAIDILVNNAMWNRYDPIERIEPATLDRMVGVGFAGIVWGIQAVAPIMRRHGGSIVNIASVAGKVGMANALLYCGIKAGVEGLTRAASVELGPDGIRVNAIAPSTIATEGVKAMLSEDAITRRIGQTPLRRLGETRDIAEAALFLASDRSSFVTGQTMLVDGGIAHAL